MRKTMSVVAFLVSVAPGQAVADMRGEVVCDVPPEEAVIVTQQLDNGSWRLWTPAAGSVAATYGTEDDALGQWRPEFVCEVVVRVNFDERLARFHRLSRDMEPADADPRAIIIGLPDLEAGSFRDCHSPRCPEMVVLPRGDLAMSRHEITVEEFRYFAEATDSEARCYGGELRTWHSPGFPQTERHPVVCVSWSDAQQYVEWLSGSTNSTYRLATEEEWLEGKSDAQPGCKIQSDDQWTASGVLYVETCPVDSHGRNSLGFFGMTGNVWEWLEDCDTEREDCDFTDGSVWYWRVAQGGYPHPDRPGTSRTSLHEYAGSTDIGFRVVKELDRFRR